MTRSGRKSAVDGIFSIFWLSLLLRDRRSKEDKKYVREQNDEFNATNVPCRLSLIVRVNVVLNRTVVVDSDFTYF